MFWINKRRLFKKYSREINLKDLNNIVDYFNNYVDINNFYIKWWGIKYVYKN